MFKISGSNNAIMTKFSEMHKEVKQAFLRIKNELEDHLEAVNENTNEIQSNQDYLVRLDSKIEKLNERIDEMQLFIQGQSFNEADVTYEISPLTNREREVFMAIYASEKDMLTADIISKKLGLTVQMVQMCISRIIRKGVPIIKKYCDNEIFLSLDKNFKRVQAKENILDIDEYSVTSLVD